MKFWRKIIFILAFLIPFISFLIPSKVFAEGEFSVDAVVTYDVQTSGKTLIKHDITLENNVSDLYATTYSLSLENINVENVGAYSQDNTILPVSTSKDGDITTIKVAFPDSSVGKGVKRNFYITYENSSFAVRTGEVWEVSIPRLGDSSNFRNYTLNLKIPKSFGLEAYISPKPDSETLGDSGYEYIFGRSSITQTGVSAGYGQFQVFSFNLSYHLENPLARTSSTQIALPPDTAFQKVYIQSIEPKPTNVTLDTDGNWLATYDLHSRQRVDVKVTGTVQIFASYRNFLKSSNEQLNNNLKETEYWQVNDPKIQELAKKLKTPKAIYDYVSTHLSYDVSRVQPNIQRKGALKALESPTESICMEFTDLFVAIARAAGIPAREIEGFAYTENPDLQPIGLVADVLHAWPEYYDNEKGVWIPIDPTWGSTTGGEDFFNKLDLRHFAFVIHGKSDKEPYSPGSYKLGPNPQKDIYVSFGQLPENRISSPSVLLKPFRILPFFSSIYDAQIKNPGPAALYSVVSNIYYDSVLKTSDVIDVMPPYSSKDVQITVPYSFLGKDTPNIIKVTVGSGTTEIITNKKQIILYSLLVGSAILIIVITIVLIRVKKINIFTFFARIVASRKKNEEKYISKPPENSDNP